MTDWKPIKTAPRDEPILLATPDGRQAVCLLADEADEYRTEKRWPWSKETRRLTNSGGTFGYYVGWSERGLMKIAMRADHDWHPTHWKPLSAPPAA